MNSVNTQESVLSGREQKKTKKHYGLDNYRWFFIVLKHIAVQTRQTEH